MSKNDPTKPTPNSEKFKPQNVQEPGATSEPPSREPDRPADTGGTDIAKGSGGDVRRGSKGTR